MQLLARASAAAIQGVLLQQRVPGLHGRVVTGRRGTTHRALRASFTNANGGPINPFTGKPVKPPPGLSKTDRLDYIRSRTHIELAP